MAVVTTTAERVDFIMVDGDTVANTFTFQDGDGDALAVDGWDWEMTVTACNGTELATVGDGITIDHPQTNQLYFLISDTVTNEADFSGSRYTLSATVNSVRRTYLCGIFTKQKMF